MHGMYIELLQYQDEAAAMARYFDHNSSCSCCTHVVCQWNVQLKEGQAAGLAAYISCDGAVLLLAAPSLGATHAASNELS